MSIEKRYKSAPLPAESINSGVKDITNGGYSANASAIVDTYFNIYGFYMRLAGKYTTDPENAMQTALVKALLGAESFRYGSPVTWLARIVRNEAVTQQRREKTQEGIIATLERHVLPVQSAEDTYFRGQTRQAVHGAIADLPADQREVIALTLDDKKPGQIARQNQIPGGAKEVYRRKHNAFGRIERHHLMREDREEE